MPAPRVTIRLQVGRDLMQRIEALSYHLDLLPSALIEQAIVTELERQEALRRREQATLAVLQHEVLSEGQSIRMETEDDAADYAVCQLCLCPVPRRRKVEGPLLCDACYALAQGNRAAAGG